MTVLTEKHVRQRRIFLQDNGQPSKFRLSGRDAKLASWYLIIKLTSPSLISSLSNVATVAVLFIAHPVKAVTESVAANNIAITFFAFIVSILFKIGIVSLVYYRAFRACWQAFSKLCKLSSISRKACGVSYAICYMIPKFG